MEDKEYTAEATLADFSADSPLGRATRVWRVKDPDGEIRVLKDVWVDETRPLEHQLYKEILADVPEHNRAFVKRHMLTPMAHCKVKVGDFDDHTVNVMLHRNPLPEKMSMFTLRSKQPAVNPNEQSTGLAVATDKNAHLTTHGVADDITRRWTHGSIIESCLKNTLKQLVLSQEHCTDCMLLAMSSRVR